MRRAYLTLLYFVCMLQLGACTIYQSPANTTVSITFAVPASKQTIYAPLITAFQQKHPNIIIATVAVNGNQDLATLAITADTAVVDYLAPTAVTSGFLYDMTPLAEVDASFERADFYPGALPSSGQPLIMLPLSLRVPLLAYNKEVWANQRLSPVNPTWTWDDLQAAVKRLAQPQRDGQTHYGWLDGAHGAVAASGALAAAGIDVVNTPIATINLDIPAGGVVLNSVADLVSTGALYLPSADQQAPIPEEASKLIQDQRLALWPAGQIATNGLPFKVGIAPLPAGSTTLAGAGGGFVMSNGTRHAQEAWQWLSFLSHQQIPPTTESIDLVPARPSLAEQSGFWKTRDPEVVSALQTALARTDAPIRTLDWRVATALQTALKEVVDGADAASALRTAQEYVVQQRGQVAPADPQALSIPTPVPTSTTLTRINFWYPYNPDKIAQLARTFHEQHPEIEVILTRRDFTSPSLTNLAATNDCFGALAGRFKPEDAPALLDIQTLIQADLQFPRSDFLPLTLLPYQQQGKLYALPSSLEVTTLWYRPDIFSTAQLQTPTAQWTIDDFINAAQRIRKVGERSQTPAYGFAGNRPSDLMAFLDRAGVSPTSNESGSARPRFDDERLQSALQS